MKLFTSYDVIGLDYKQIQHGRQDKRLVKQLMN